MKNGITTGGNSSLGYNAVMTEAEWSTCTDPKPMLDFVRKNASDRKVRLFGVAVCRQFKEQLGIKAFADALEAAEQYADTMKTKAALKRVRNQVKAIRHGIPNGDKTRFEEWSGLWLAEDVASENAFGGVGDEVVRLASLGLIPPDKPILMIKLLRCVTALKPSRPVALDSRDAPPVAALAKTIYDERVFERVPELADVLEQAGCTDDEVLAHCRGGGDHVRGCWVVDLLLGKR